MKTRITTTTLFLLLALACDDAETKDLEPTHGAYFAVLSTNYGGATAISLLDEEGEVLEHEWASSAIENGDLRTPLSEDVVLPTTADSRRFLTTIERGLGVITRFDLEDASVVGQVRTDDSPEGDDAAYDSNPQDVYYADEATAWVSRWAPNPNPDAEESERGTDLIAFDPGAMERMERRIDLSGLDTTVTEDVYDENFEVVDQIEATAYARPARIVGVGDHLVVGLVRATDGFSYAPGAIAVVDPAAGEVTDEVVFDDLVNCGDVHPVAGASNRVLVACIGDWSFLGPETGLVMLEIDDQGKAEIVERFAAGEDQVATGQLAASVGGSLAVAVASGSTDFETRELVEPDRLYVVDLSSGEQTMVHESEGAFSLGIPAFDPETGLLVVPDAGNDEDPIYGVYRFQVGEDGSVEELGFVEVAPETTLAARQAQRL